MLPTIELCEGCQKEYHKAYQTDDGVWLCATCYVEILKSALSRIESENAELKKYLKHARDDKKIRLGEIEGLEEKNTELRDAIAHLQRQCDRLRAAFVESGGGRRMLVPIVAVLAAGKE